MSDSESDEDLKRAIALSLEDQSPPSKRDRVVIDITSSDEDLDAPFRPQIAKACSK